MDIVVYELTFPLIFVCSAILLFVITRFIESRVEKKTQAKTFMKRIHVPVEILVVLAFLYLFFEILVMHPISNPILDKILTIVMILGFGCLAVKGLDLLTAMILQYYEIRAKDNLHARTVHTSLGVIKMLVKAVLITVVVICALMTFEIVRAQGMHILASAGVLSIIVGLAAQKTIGNFFSGLQIAIAQPIRVEDVVVLENELGTIEEIHMTYVVVKLWDLRRMIVPIAYFTDHIFLNWTQRSADILAPVFLYVDYAMPLQPLREEIDRILEGNKLWDRKTKAVQVVEMLEHAIQVRVLVSAANSAAAFELRCVIREQLMDFMHKNYPEFLPRFRTELTRESIKRV